MTDRKAAKNHIETGLTDVLGRSPSHEEQIAGEGYHHFVQHGETQARRHRRTREVYRIAAREHAKRVLPQDAIDHLDSIHSPDHFFED